MKPMLHTYGKAYKFIQSILVGGGFFFPLILVALIYMDSPKNFNGSIASSESLYRLLIYSVAYWPFCLITVLISAYFYSDITTDADGLFVDFLWFKLHVKWSQLIKIKPLLGMKIPIFGKRKAVVLLMHGLTPFHRIFGLIYGFSIYPAIIINPSISDYDLLMQQIKLELDKDST